MLQSTGNIKSTLVRCCRHFSSPRLVSASEAVTQGIKSYQRIFVHGAAQIPILLLDALAERHQELKGVEFVHLHLESPNPCSDDKFKSAFFANNLFVGANQRQAVAKGYSSYVPIFLSEMPKLLLHGPLVPDVALLNVSPPDKHGYCSLGTEVALANPAARSAKVLIAQINPAVPRTHGSSFVHYSDFDYVVEHEQPLVESAPKSSQDKVEEAIGQNIADLITDGCTLQMGIGGIPNAVLSQISKRSYKNLGIHTEMFTDGAIDLLERGIVNNKLKSFIRGKTLTSFVVGSKRLYDFIDDNPSIQFMDAATTNNPRIIGTNPKVVAINSAIEIDITGQVCADSIGTYQMSGVGGQIDFERGAAISSGGVPVIALPSRTHKGISRIVSTLKPGSGVITTRYHVHWVVTEFGKVDLFGLNIHQRAKALIQLAHPDDREQLEKDAFERFQIKSWI